MLTKVRQGWILAVALTVLGPSWSLLAQTAATGALTGTVTDSTGAVVVNATITATSIDTSQVRTATTGGDGSYKIPLLPPGMYRVKFEAPGFKTADILSATISVTETDVLNQSLEVGAQAQQVTVEAEVEAVQTATSTVGTVITSVAELPLATRNYTDLLALSAGANATIVNAASALGKGNEATSVNGASNTDNNYQMDGAPISNFATAGTIAETGAFAAFGIPNPDAIEEFKIQTSTYDASYGRNSGGNVNVVTKSGTNEFHGTAFEFFRNTDLNANDFFYKSAELASGKPNVQPVVNQNQFGGVFGGPVKKDKLFFFVSYQETRQKNGLATQGSSPFTLPYITPASIAPDRNSAAFLNDMLAHYCGASGNLGGIQIKAPSGGCNSTSPFSGAYSAGVATASISPQSLAILQLKLPSGQYYIPSPITGSSQVICNPTPTSSSTGPQYSCTSSIPAVYAEHQGLGNWDYVINKDNTLSGRYFVANEPTTVPFPISGSLPGEGAQSLFVNHDAVLKLTSILTSNVVNEARVSYQRNIAHESTTGTMTSTGVGITPISSAFDLLPQMTVGSFSIGTPTKYGVLNLADQFEYADQVSWTKGKHSLRFGAETERYLQVYDFPNLSIGDLTYSTFQDFLISLPGCTPGDALCSTTHPTTTVDLNGNAVQNNGTANSNFSVAGFNTRYLATPSGYLAGLYGDYKLTDYDAFVQDDFKVSSGLTLNIGLRWEYDGLTTEDAGKNTSVYPSRVLSVPYPLVTTACTAAVFQSTGCPGSSFAGYVVPANYRTPPLPPLPAGVFQSSHNILPENNPAKDQFAPRFGLAWQPLSKNDKWVVRAGAGYFYSRVPGDQFADVAIGNIPYSYSFPSVYNDDLANPYGPTTPGWQPRWVTASGVNSNISQSSIAQNFATPLVYEWNLNTQYELAPSWVLELGYVGSRGIHQWHSEDVNPALLVGPGNPAPTSGTTALLTSNTALRVPYAGFATTWTLQSTAFDFKYNSAQATLRKQMSHGFNFQAAYTWSRAFLSQQVGNPNASLAENVPVITEYSLNPNYHPQRFSLNYNWNLPFGNPGGFEGKLVTGWTVSGVTIIQDGTPLTITDSRLGTIFGPAVTSNAQFTSGFGNANVASAGSLYDRVTSGNYFNSAAFTNLPVGGPGGIYGNGRGYGNSGLGIILGPPQNNFDITVAKVTNVGGIREGATLEFRTDFLNAFNHTQFSNPASTVVTNGSFGKILSASVNPRLVQFALKYQF